MRADLHTASRPLGLTQRLKLRGPLHRTALLLEDTETVRVLAPVWWRGHRALAVLTDTRLLLVRRPSEGSPVVHTSFPFRRITHLTVHSSPPQGVRVRIMIGLDLKEFTTTGPSTELEQALRAATA